MSALERVVCERTIRNTWSEARSESPTLRVSLESRQVANRSDNFSAPEPGGDVLWDRAAEVARSSPLTQVTAVPHARLRPGSRVQAATGLDQQIGPVGMGGDPTRIAEPTIPAGKSDT